MFKLFGPAKNTDLRKVAEKQLQKNVRVIESLRDYDAGKKDISTHTAEERLLDVRAAS
jgi:hypothetical protein